MKWIAEDVVYLSCADEISSGYVKHRANETQFSVPKPYQARSSLPIEESCLDTGGSQILSHDIPESNGPAPSSGKPRSAEAKRKRSGVTKDAQRAAREREAQQRHLEVHEQLLKAYKSYLALRSQHERQENSTRGVAESTDPEGCLVSDSAYGKLDLIALSHMKQVVRPKLTIAAAAGHTEILNLFDQLISNDGDHEVVADAAGNAVLLPPRSMFMIADITRWKALLTGCPKEGFDTVVMDPPWENASAQRSAAYPTLPSRNLLSIPMKRLLHQEAEAKRFVLGLQERGVLALWVTNRERHRRFVDAELLPAWGLCMVASWYWLKVTDDGQLVSPLDIAYRRPYEVLLLCRPLSAALQAAVPKEHHAADLSKTEEPCELASPDASQASKPLRDLMIVAVPGQHSRKPFIGRLLLSHLPKQPSCLEVFARELHAGWTSIGNETLLFQTLDHFTELQ